MFNRLILTPLLILSLWNPAIAEEVAIPFDKRQLNAELQLAEGSSLSDGVILITHGTLAHNKMEIIATLQSLLADEGINTLAVNLSLSIDNRHGMYDCAVPHQHKHTDALQEIDAWITWLKAQGAPAVALMGHSRGGNQSAWFSNLNPDLVSSQILVAPATWSEASEQASYQERYGKSLSELLANAKQADPNSWLENTDFIYCKDSKVLASSFINYYQPDPQFDTPTLLKTTQVPTLVFSGTEDKVVPDLAEKMQLVTNPLVTHTVVEGADHYFLDLYADQIVESVIEFLGQQ